MADDEVDERGSQEGGEEIPAVWKAALGDPKDEVQFTGPQVGKIVKVLNDFEDDAELQTELQRRNPRNKEETLLMWATLQKKFVLVEWLVKRAAQMTEAGGRKVAFAFGGEHSEDAKVVQKEMQVFEQWVEKRKEEEEARKEKEEARRQAEADGEEIPEEEEEEADPLWKKVKEAVGDEELDDRMVQSVGQLGVYQGKREGGKKGRGTKWGIGQAIFPNGDMYVGEYMENRRHGIGTYVWGGEGNMYIGSWVNGQRAGWGRMVFADGGRYLGNWRHDKQNGEGRYTYPNGDTYSGCWQNNIKEGQGIFTFAADSSQYIGSFRNGDFVSGEWRLGGGTRYYGVFKNFEPVGKGIFVHRHGQEGAYTQDGEYSGKVWVPARLRSADEPNPDLDISVQGRTLRLRFSDEASGQQRGASSPLAALVQVANFPPFLEWVRGLSDPRHPYFKDHFLVKGVCVRSIDWDPASQLVRAVRLKVDAVNEDGERWARLGFPDAESITLTAPTQRLVCLLRHGEGQLLIWSRRPLLAAGDMLAPMLPEVSFDGNGNLTGSLVPKLKDLGLDLTMDCVENISQLTSGYGAVEGGSKAVEGLRVHEPESNAEVQFLYYAQTVTTEFWEILNKKVESINGKNDEEVMETITIDEAMTVTPDATTVAALFLVRKLEAAKRISASTAAEMRPPTPPPPLPEERPEIPPPPEPEKPIQTEVEGGDEGGGDE